MNMIHPLPALALLCLRRAVGKATDGTWGPAAEATARGNGAFGEDQSSPSPLKKSLAAG